MSLSHTILGFLSIKPMTGYDLKKVFDQSVRHFWPANQSQIYRTLAELRSEGFVEQEVIEREDRLDMKLYNITHTGSQELNRWLSTPLPEQDYREAFLIQIYFGGKLTDTDVITLIKHEIKNLEGANEQYTGMLELYRGKMQQNPTRELFFSVIPLEYGLTSNQSALDWLNKVLDRIETGDYSIIDPIKTKPE